MRHEKSFNSRLHPHSVARSCGCARRRARYTPKVTHYVLLVDDDDAIRAQLREFLEGEGFRVVTAGNGVEALDCLQAADELPGVIVLDLAMPAMNGSEFLALRNVNSRF